MRKPFWRKSHKCWYVKGADGAFIRLDPDENKAFDIWETLRSLQSYDHVNATALAVFEHWLDLNESKLSIDRYKKLKTIFEDFVRHFGKEFVFSQLDSDRMEKWLGKSRTWRKRKLVWSVARQRDAGQAVVRVYRWANSKGWIPTSDILAMRFASPSPRDELLTREIHERLVAHTRSGLKRSRPYGLILIALWHSGARPVQIRSVTRKHVTPEGDWLFRKHKTSEKVKGARLVVRTTPCLQTLTKILTAARPNGPLFLTAQGKPWTRCGIIRRLARMKESLGITEPFTAYSYRHTFATDALLAGVDISAVAALLGHSSPAMVAKVYGHVGKHNQPLRDAVLKIRGG